MSGGEGVSLFKRFVWGPQVNPRPTYAKPPAPSPPPRKWPPVFTTPNHPNYPGFFTNLAPPFRISLCTDARGIKTYYPEELYLLEVNDSLNWGDAYVYQGFYENSGRSQIGFEDEQGALEFMRKRRDREILSETFIPVQL